MIKASNMNPLGPDNNKTEHDDRGLAKAMESGLPVMAIVVSCCVCLFSKTSFFIQTPMILALASLYMLLPLRSSSMKASLQKLIGFYLIFVLVNELTSRQLDITIRSVNISVSWGVITLILYTAGFLIGLTNSNKTVQNNDQADVMVAILLGVGLIVGHMLLLWPMLNRFYGYGYEHNLNVLGSLCLYVLLFVFLRRQLDIRLFRQIVGVILVFFYLAVTI